MTNEAITIIWLAELKRAFNLAAPDPLAVKLWSKVIDEQSAAMLTAMRKKRKA